MNNVIYKNIFRFILLLLLQIYVFDNINVWGYLNPYVYVLFILLLPLETPRFLLFFASFIMVFDSLPASRFNSRFVSKNGIGSRSKNRHKRFWIQMVFYLYICVGFCSSSHLFLPGNFSFWWIFTYA